MFCIISEGQAAAIYVFEPFLNSVLGVTDNMGVILPAAFVNDFVLMLYRHPNFRAYGFKIPINTIANLCLCDWTR